MASTRRRLHAGRAGRQAGSTARVACEHRAPVVPRAPLVDLPVSPRLFETTCARPSVDGNFNIERGSRTKPAGAERSLLVEPPGVVSINAAMHIDDEFESEEVSCDLPVTYRTHPRSDSINAPAATSAGAGGPRAARRPPRTNTPAPTRMGGGGPAAPLTGRLAQREPAVPSVAEVAPPFRRRPEQEPVCAANCSSSSSRRPP